MTYWLKILSLSFCVAAFGVTAHGYSGAVSSGTANAGVAAVEVSETPYFNPASLAHITGYYFSSGYVSSAEGDSAFAISLTDNMRDTVVPTSIAYVQSSFGEGPQREDQERMIRLSLGNFAGPAMAFGLAISHQENRTPLERNSQTNLDLGALFTINSSLGIAVLAENLLPASDSLPENQRMESATGIGLAYNYKKFLRAKADLVTNGRNNWGKPSLRGGFEYYLNRWIIGRLGYEENTFAEQATYSGGLGFKLPRFGLHYAYQSISQENNKDSRHTVDLAIPIW